MNCACETPRVSMVRPTYCLRCGLNLEKPMSKVPELGTVAAGEALLKINEEILDPNCTNLNALAAIIFHQNYKWWHDREGRRLERNKGELLALIHSEISECLEGVRKCCRDDKLTHRMMEEVELADAVIRILDYAGAFGLDLDGSIAEKRRYNATRKDHTHEARFAPGGKAF